MLSSLSQPLYSQLLNGNFENWTELNGTLALDNWEITSSCWGVPDTLTRDTDSNDGEFSLKVTSECDGWEYDHYFGVVSQTVQLDNKEEIPNSISFYYKVKNLRLIDSLPGCGFISIFLEDDLQNSKNKNWGGGFTEETPEWIKGVLDLPELDFTPTKYTIRIIGGGCGEIGNLSTLDFLVDQIQSDFVVSNNNTTKNEIQIYPNPFSEFIHIREAKNNTVEVFSIDGKLLFQSEISNDFFQIAVDDFMDNILIVSVSNKDGDIVNLEKLVRQ